MSHLIVPQIANLFYKKHVIKAPKKSDDPKEQKQEPKPQLILNDKYLIKSKKSDEELHILLSIS